MDIAVGITTAHVKLDTEAYYYSLWRKRWKNQQKLKVTKALYLHPNKFKLLSKLRRKKLNVLIKAATGHGLFCAHLALLRSCNKVCSLCEEKPQTSWHLWQSALQSDGHKTPMDRIAEFWTMNSKSLVSSHPPCSKKVSEDNLGR